jgi:molybdenum-dependent DNA-binding transcriptional regulator ModE
MFKQKAIELLGGSITAAAEAIGITYQAVNKWPEQLPPRIEDRVMAAISRKKAKRVTHKAPADIAQAATN